MTGNDMLAAATAYIDLLDSAAIIADVRPTYTLAVHTIVGHAYRTVVHSADSAKRHLVDIVSETHARHHRVTRIEVKPDMTLTFNATGGRA